MGVYIANIKIIDFIEPSCEYGFDRLMNDLLTNKLSPKVRKHAGYWLDIGRPDDYMKAIEDYEQRKSIFEI